MAELVDEFVGYVTDVFSQELDEATRQQKLRTIMAKFENASMRKASSTMLAIDVDASQWPDEELSERMLRHVLFRAGKNNMMPSHCMMLEAGKRLHNGKKKAPREWIETRWF